MTLLLRWPGWEDDLAPLSGDQGIAVVPFLFAREGGPVAQRSRRVVAMTERWRLHRELALRLKQLPEGAPFSVHASDHLLEDT